MVDKPKVVAEVESREVTIDQKSGVDQITSNGKFKGFGQGFKDYIAGSIVNLSVEILTGEYPAGHAKAGRWTVRAVIDDFATEEDAAMLADRISPKIKGLVASCNASMPVPMPGAKQ
jgi:hypothetical protein